MRAEHYHPYRNVNGIEAMHQRGENNDIESTRRLGLSSGNPGRLVALTCINSGLRASLVRALCCFPS